VEGADEKAAKGEHPSERSQDPRDVGRVLLGVGEGLRAIHQTELAEVSNKAKRADELEQENLKLIRESIHHLGEINELKESRDQLSHELVKKTSEVDALLYALRLFKEQVRLTQLRDKTFAFNEEKKQWEQVVPPGDDLKLAV
jgi:hypothetical protein